MNRSVDLKVFQFSSGAMFVDSGHVFSEIVVNETTPSSHDGLIIKHRFTARFPSLVK